MFAADNLSTEDPTIFSIEIRTRRGTSGLWSQKVLVYLTYNPDMGEYKLLGIRRET